MQENVRKELDALEEMLLNWKASYLGFATPEGGNDFLVEDFQEEITTYISPYVRRLFQWKPKEVQATLQALVETSHVHGGFTLPDKTEECFVAAALVE